MPAVSVVIPTCNRSERLQRALQGLAAQEGVDDFEVIVVDDASTDGTEHMLKATGADYPFRLAVLRQDANRRPAAARNVGWHAARSPIVAFTDDDCVPTPKWLMHLLGGFSHADIVVGPTVVDPAEESSLRAFCRTMQAPLDNLRYSTCNIAYRREILDRVGGFDESFLTFGEDTDLAWRAREAGARPVFIEDALVHHAVHPPNLRASLEDARRRDGIPQLLKRHPYLRNQLGERLFREPTHVPALSLLGSLALLGLRPRSWSRWVQCAAMGGWYAHRARYHNFKPRGRRWRWVWVVPAAWALDLYEIGVLARASIRYRYLQL